MKTFYTCAFCGVKVRKVDKGNASRLPPCSENHGFHVWNADPSESPNSGKRVIRYEITTPAQRESRKGLNWAERVQRPRVIARWDKKRGLLWRKEPSRGYGADDFDAYWKATQANPSAIHAAIKQVGEYLANGELAFDAATELLDLLHQALDVTLK